MTTPLFTDPDDDEDSGDGEESGASEANASFKDLRKAYNRAEKERKALEAEAIDLRTFKATTVEKERAVQLEVILKESGLSPKHATLFTKLNPEAEITPETVLGFAKEYDLVKSDGEGVEVPEKPASGFNPVSTGVGGDLKTYTREELDVLVYTNPDLANKLIQEGRVELTRTKKA